MHHACVPLLLFSTQVLYNFKNELQQWLPKYDQEYKSPLTPNKVFLADKEAVSTALIITSLRSKQCLRCLSVHVKGNHGEQIAR